MSISNNFKDFLAGLLSKNISYGKQYTTKQKNVSEPQEKELKDKAIPINNPGPEKSTDKIKSNINTDYKTPNIPKEPESVINKPEATPDTQFKVKSIDQNTHDPSVVATYSKTNTLNKPKILNLVHKKY